MCVHTYTYMCAPQAWFFRAPSGPNQSTCTWHPATDACQRSHLHSWPGQLRAEAKRPQKTAWLSRQHPTPRMSGADGLAIGIHARNGPPQRRWGSSPPNNSSIGDGPIGRHEAVSLIPSPCWASSACCPVAVLPASALQESCTCNVAQGTSCWLWHHWRGGPADKYH